MTETDKKHRFTCPCLRLFAPLRKQGGDTMPSWDELELRAVRDASTIELRLLHRSAETGSLLARRRGESKDVELLSGPNGPAWCRELLLDAANEWARERAANESRNPR